MTSQPRDPFEKFRTESAAIWAEARVENAKIFDEARRKIDLEAKKMYFILGAAFLLSAAFFAVTLSLILH